jgi:hypothetical protein
MLVRNKLGIIQVAFPFSRPDRRGAIIALSSMGNLFGRRYVADRKGEKPLPLDHASDLVVLGQYA